MKNVFGVFGMMFPGFKPLFDAAQKNMDDLDADFECRQAEARARHAQMRAESNKRMDELLKRP